MKTIKINHDDFLKATLKALDYEALKSLLRKEPVLTLPIAMYTAALGTALFEYGDDDPAGIIEVYATEINGTRYYIMHDVPNMVYRVLEYRKASFLTKSEAFDYVNQAYEYIIHKAFTKGN